MTAMSNPKPTTFRKWRPSTRADVDRARVPGGHDPGGGGRIVRGDVERLGEVAARCRRRRGRGRPSCPSAGWRCRRCSRCRHRPRPRSAGSPARCACCGDRDLVPGARGAGVGDGRAPVAWASASRTGRGHACAPALARGRVEDDEDVVRPAAKERRSGRLELDQGLEGLEAVAHPLLAERRSRRRRRWRAAC